MSLRLENLAASLEIRYKVFHNVSHGLNIVPHACCTSIFPESQTVESGRHSTQHRKDKPIDGVNLWSLS